MEEQHPIENLMLTAMNSIKQMIDVNTIIGSPIKAAGNTTIIPISKVGFGFAAGGSEFNDETVNSYNRKEKEENIKYRLPFGGGSGACANITPVAFLIVQNDTVKLLEATHSSVLEKLVEYVPDVIDKFSQLFNRTQDKQEQDSKFSCFEDEIKNKYSKKNVDKKNKEEKVNSDNYANLANEEHTVVVELNEEKDDV